MFLVPLLDLLVRLGGDVVLLGWLGMVRCGGELFVAFSAFR